MKRIVLFAVLMTPGAGAIACTMPRITNTPMMVDKCKAERSVDGDECECTPNQAGGQRSSDPGALHSLPPRLATGIFPCVFSAPIGYSYCLPRC